MAKSGFEKRTAGQILANPLKPEFPAAYIVTVSAKPLLFIFRQKANENTKIL